MRVIVKVRKSLYVIIKDVQKDKPAERELCRLFLWECGGGDGVR